jgi:hypothetical protein
MTQIRLDTFNTLLLSASVAGRSGAILTPIVIETLVGMSLTLNQNFMAIFIHAVITNNVVLLINISKSASWQRGKVGWSVA